MNAGYRYDREASAKATKLLKIATKNAKKDKVLYGAIIKAESVFDSSSSDSNKDASTQTGSSSTSSGSDDPQLLKKLREPVSVISTVSAKTEPVKIDPFDKAANSTNMVGLSPLVDELKKKLLLSNLGLKPRDSRQPNVSVGSQSPSPPPSVASSSSIPTLSTESPVSVGAPSLTRSDTNATVDLEHVPVHPNVQRMSNSNSSSASSISEESDESEEKSLKIDYRTDETTQSLAKQFCDLENEAKSNPDQKNHRISAFLSSGIQYVSKEPSKINVRLENGKYRFDFTYTKGSQRFSRAISMFPNEFNIDIKLTLREAIAANKNGLNNPDRRVGETTGKGIADSSADIGSSRVVYKSSKGGKDVAKGQLYLMRPQLIKGHIRLYNKSGRPVVSRSSVSPSFQRLAKDIVERNTFEADDYSNIDPKESADVNKFIEATKPIQPRNINRLSNADTVWQLKKRYEVLVGELSAGNTGKLVRDEMETILRNLMRLHAMNIDKGRELIKSLREW